MFDLIKQGDCLDVMKEFPDGIVQCVVTSPPYFGLRDYGLEPSEWREVVFQPAPGLPEMTIPAMSCCLGLEPTPLAFVGHMVEVFREVRRVLRDDGTVWLNLGDSYNGSGGAGGDYAKGGLKEGQPKYPGRKLTDLKPKDLIGIPWRVALALQADGWYLRQDIIWHKPNPMPESVKDRCTKAHEYLFLLSKRDRYYFDAEAIAEPAECGRLRGSGPMSPSGAGRNDSVQMGDYRIKRSGNKARKQRPGSPDAHNGAQAGSVPWEGNTRNKRSVWTIATKPFPEAHFATFPPKLIEPCILAGTRKGDIVLDPFMGSGTTAEVCIEHERGFVGAELNPDYIEIQSRRITEAHRKAALPKQMELFSNV